MAVLESTVQGSPERRVVRETAIGLVVSGLALAAMAADHLIPGDAVAFLITSALALGLAALLFGRVIPRIKADPAAPVLAAKRGIVISLLAVLSIPTLFVGFPFVLGGAGVALGLLGRDGERKRLATAAVVIGALVVLFATGAYIAMGGNTE